MKLLKSNSETINVKHYIGQTILVAVAGEVTFDANGCISVHDSVAEDVIKYTADTFKFSYAEPQKPIDTIKEIEGKPVDPNAGLDDIKNLPTSKLRERAEALGVEIEIDGKNRNRKEIEADIIAKIKKD